MNWGGVGRILEISGWTGKPVLRETPSSTFNFCTGFNTFGFYKERPVFQKIKQKEHPFCNIFKYPKL